MSRIIAMLWDFDKTLIRGYMQTPLFEHYGVDAIEFWNEVNALPEFYRAQSGIETLESDFLYLNHILTYVRRGVFSGLSNKKLRELGAEQSMAPGVPELFDHIAAFVRAEPKFLSADISVEHYVISTGLRQMVLGSPVAPHMRFVWGCEFLETEAPPGFLEGARPVSEGVIRDIGYVIDHTSKTRAIFEINKGSRELEGAHVNAMIERSKRRVPFENMIYVADGVSDIPSLSVVAQSGGRTFGVFQPDSPRDRAQAELLLDQNRVEAIGPADFRQDGETYAWLIDAIAQIAERLIQTPRDDAPTPPPPPMPAHIYDYRKP